MRQAGWLTFAGLAIGLVCSMGASLLVRDLLFGVGTWDAATLGCVAVLLGLTSMAASFLPARRAASVNPTDALRAEWEREQLLHLYSREWKKPRFSG